MSIAKLRIKTLVRWLAYQKERAKKEEKSDSIIASFDKKLNKLNVIASKED